MPYLAVSTIELRNGGNGWTTPVVTNISNGCAAVVAEANVRSVEELPGSQPRNPERLNFALGCQTASLDEQKGLALVECRSGKSHADGMFVSTSSHQMDVLSLTSKKAVFSVPLSHGWHGLSGILANSGEQEYVILVKEGINIEVYRLPR